MGKLVSWVVLGLFVVVVPFGSWYYLKKGLDFRKKALSELLVKDSISVLDSQSVFMGKTSVLYIKNDPEVSKNLSAINEQFKKTEGFQIVGTDSLPPFVQLKQGYMADFLVKYEGKSYVLMDQKGYVRNSYGNNIDDIKKMIEHIAITIPRPREADIKMKQ